MVSHNIQVFIAQNEGTFRAKDNLVERFTETSLVNCIQIATSGEQGSLIHQICQISTNHTRSAACSADKINVIRQWHTACVDLENSQTAIPIGTIDRHTAIKATRTQ